MNIPYYKQKTDYTCGPACLKMVFEYLGEKTTKRELAAILNTTPEAGTHTDEMSRVARAHGFAAFEKRDASLEDIKDFISRDHPVIVDFIEPGEEERHFSVIVGFDENNFIFNDPWHGEGFTMPIDEFEKRWASPENRYPKWLMVVSKREEDLR